jgi:hypothetical protein
MMLVHTSAGDSRLSAAICGSTTSHVLGHPTAFFVRGRYSGQYFPASLCSLPTLEYVPCRVCVPTDRLLHKCQFCWEIDGVQPPFLYVLDVRRTRGQPSWEEAGRHAIDDDSTDEETTGVGRDNGYSTWPS